MFLFEGKHCSYINFIFGGHRNFSGQLLIEF